MRKLIVCLLLGISLAANAQVKERDKILKVLEDQRTAWNAGNLEGYMAGYLKSDSLIFIGSRGPTYGWQQTLDNYKKSYPDKAAMGFLTFGIKDVKFLSKECAFVVGSWHLKRAKDEPKGYFTLVFKKIKGVWKVVSDHSS